VAHLENNELFYVKAFWVKIPWHSSDVISSGHIIFPSVAK